MGIRNWLILKLVGRKSVVINACFVNTEVSMSSVKGGLVAHNDFLSGYHKVDTTKIVIRPIKNGK